MAELFLAMAFWFPLLFPDNTGRIAAAIVKAYRAAMKEDHRA